MTCATATFHEIASFDGRPSLGVARPGALRRIVVSLGTVAAAGATVALVTVVAAWIVATSISFNLNLHSRASIGLATAVLPSSYRALADADDFGDATVQSAPASEVIREAALPAPEPDPDPDPARKVPPREAPQKQARLEPARPSAAPVLPQVAMAAPPPPSSILRKPPPQAHADANALPDLDGRTAIYDIQAHTVYLPHGERLEAHSGLGESLDNPRYVNLRDRGPTPPNVYDLTLREELFHGVRAIRLNPVDDSKTFGRDGMLAHTYMLGPSGQSFGCVSFKDYDAFLHAFLKGEVDRLVVVPHLGTTVSRATLAGQG